MLDVLCRKPPPARVDFSHQRSAPPLPLGGEGRGEGGISCFVARFLQSMLDVSWLFVFHLFVLVLVLVLVISRHFIGCSMLVVECWMFPPYSSVSSSSVPAQYPPPSAPQNQNPPATTGIPPQPSSLPPPSAPPPSADVPPRLLSGSFHPARPNPPHLPDPTPPGHSSHNSPDLHSPVP